MKSIPKLQITNVLVRTAAALLLTITGCSKKDPVAPSTDMNKSKSLNMRVSTATERPNSVIVHVNGLAYGQHLNAKFQYCLVRKDQTENNTDWREDWAESRYESYNQAFTKKEIFVSNGSNALRAPFIDGERYIFRIAYNIVGGGDELFYTAPTEPVIVRAKRPRTTGILPLYPTNMFTKSMTITPDYNAASTYPLSEEAGGVIVLNFTELINIDLSNIKRAIIKTRVTATGSDYHKINHEYGYNRIEVLCDHIDDRFIIQNLAKGISYDIKIYIDGVERTVKDVTASGTKQALHIKN